MEHVKNWLRYVDVANVRDKTLDLSKIPIKNGSDENLGDVAGLVVDEESGRPYYIVMDAGGWFGSKHVLIPIGQVHLTPEHDSFRVFLTKEQVKRSPGFDRDEFAKWTDGDVARVNRNALDVWEATTDSASDYTSVWERPSYRVPAWWTSPSLGTSSPAVSRSDRPVGRNDTGRAQPGDVIGVETDGETTNLGDTKEDEIERRRRAAEHARHP